jgi:hypothetical protein
MIPIICFLDEVRWVTFYQASKLMHYIRIEVTRSNSGYTHSSDIIGVVPYYSNNDDIDKFREFWNELGERMGFVPKFIDHSQQYVHFLEIEGFEFTDESYLAFVIAHNVINHAS